MKFLFAIPLILGALNLQAQGHNAVDKPRDIIKIKQSITTKQDTTSLYFDENGSTIPYYKYSQLLSSGRYLAKTNADDVPKKLALKKLSDEEYERFNALIRENTKIRTDNIYEGKPLNTESLAALYTKQNLKNKVIVQIFWSASCNNCGDGFSAISAYVNEIGNPEELIILAITPDEESVAAKKWKENPLKGAELVTGAKALAEAYEINDYPSYIVTDQNNTIKYAVEGNSRLTIPDLKVAIKNALGK